MNRRHAHLLTAPIAALLLMLVAIPAAAAGASAGKATGFLTGPKPGDAGDIAQAYLAGHLDQLGLSAADLADMVVQDRYTTRHNGVTHVYLTQRLAGIEVYNGIINVNVAADGSIISLGNRFVSNLAAEVNTRGPVLTDRQAIERAAEHFGLIPTELVLLEAAGGPEQRATFADAALSRDDIPARLVYQPLEGGGGRLAWETVLNLVESPDWWSLRVDAANGEVISQHNWTNNDTYRAIPFPPFADPEDAGGGAGQTDIVDPADATASPFGWHDTDGMAGAEFTDTQGNNVDAHDDIDANNTGGLRAEGGAALDFLFDFDPALQPTGGTNLEAAIVNLFYGNNVMHDLTYQYGFDEASGNFQTNNYGNGGIGGDQVEADAQDGSGTNNANFSTPPDGGVPRMQMFVWTDGGPVENARVSENSPTERDFVAGQGAWGGALEPATTADTELVNGGGDFPTEGCGALIGFTPGNIALIDRGTCEFGAKALNAEMAGASGAIIVNNQQLPNGIIAMGAGAVGGMVTIPAVMIGNADGQLIKDELAAGTVNVTLQCPVGGCPTVNPINRDSDLDNGVVAHEYGHGISNRLTGGPGNVGCLTGAEQAGEGWSDFWTMMLTAKASDTPTTEKGVGNYVSFLSVNGPGIRNFPYTTDLAVNPQTYMDIAFTNAPHGVGEIWMDMVWEVYWELVLKHGFDTDLYNGTGGNNLTIQLVIDGMKMQPCGPTFVDARDAILAADLANNAGANACEIWRGFAKRGLGTGAIAGGTGVGDETEDFSIPPECPAIVNIFSDGFESGDCSAWNVSVPPC